MTQQFCYILQNGAYSCTGLSSFLNQIRYQNLNMVTVR